MIKCVIYDLDDTLYDFNEVNPPAFKLMCEEAGRRFNMDPEKFGEVFGTAYRAVGDRMPEDILALEPDKPMIFTEYGADTHAAIDKLPSVMWSESYQIELLEMCERVFDSYDAIVGEQVWNFADFQTTEGIMRVDGNKKGVFTRQRQPKRAAFHLKARWDALPHVGK